MVFEAEPDEYFRPDRQVGIIVAIHSPNNIINPFYSGFVIKPGNIYSVHLKVVSSDRNVYCNVDYLHIHVLLPPASQKGGKNIDFQTF